MTGRWAANGGGALQLPHQVRSAVVADPGWKLVVADAAQLEPRVLAGPLGRRLVMAEAGRGGDMYQGIVDAGAVETRAQAERSGCSAPCTAGRRGRADACSRGSRRRSRVLWTSSSRPRARASAARS